MCPLLPDSASSSSAPPFRPTRSPTLRLWCGPFPPAVHSDIHLEQVYSVLHFPGGGIVGVAHNLDLAGVQMQMGILEWLLAGRLAAGATCPTWLLSGPAVLLSTFVSLPLSGHGRHGAHEGPSITRPASHGFQSLWLRSSICVLVFIQPLTGNSETRLCKHLSDSGTSFRHFRPGLTGSSGKSCEAVDIDILVCTMSLLAVYSGCFLDAVDDECSVLPKAPVYHV